MKTRHILLLSFLFLLICSFQNSPAQTNAASDSDSFLWLENANDPKALDWVKAQDDLTTRALESDSNFEKFRNISLEILNSKDRIPDGSYDGKYVYNFWQDENHIKGILRRATLEEYVKKDPQWETVLDIDKLSADEGKDYVFHGSTTFPPARTRGMMALSIGGTDAAINREFDYTIKSFVPDGFVVPEAKSDVSWYDENTLLIGTDFGPGSMTSSGYPRIVKLWKRGTPLSEAKTIMEGENSDVSASGYVAFRPEGNCFILQRGINYWESQKWLVDSGGNRIELPFPKDSYVQPFKGRLLVQLNSDWFDIPEGSLAAVKIADLRSPNLKSKIEIIFKPDEKSTINSVSTVKDYIIVSILQNVRGKVLYYALDDSNGVDKWIRGEINLPDLGKVKVHSSDDFNNTLMISYENFLNPTKLYLFENPQAAPEEIKALPAGFDASDMKVEQFSATSKDGTSIPYFMVSRKDLKLDGSNPTLLYGYGGFRSAQTPFYSRTVGKIWLTNGGVYVLANIRGGDEFGPRWHKAGLLENRQKVFDDFIAVAEDLINKKVTSPRRLGIMGGSNGGLLVGAAFTQRPDLFNAVVCQVPLLDMLRYNKIGAGASWMAEYGNPDIPEQRAYIAKYSPYQNLKAGAKYPEVFFETSTADDRVHPAHARKMAARMEQMGYKVYYFEEMTGGHSAGVDNNQEARRYSLEYTYLWKMLK